MDNLVKQEKKSSADLEYNSFSSWANNKDNDDIADNNDYNKFKKLFLELPDKIFYDLLKIRLKLPVFKERDEVEVEPDREYWPESYTIDQLFNEISRTVEIITFNGKKITVRRYYNRALKIFKFISFAKSDLEFVINISDLSPRVIAELKVLDKISADYVLKQAVFGIFQNINSERYHSRVLLRD